MAIWGTLANYGKQTSLFRTSFIIGKKNYEISDLNNHFIVSPNVRLPRGNASSSSAFLGGDSAAGGFSQQG